jgi:hypothetical protein
MLNLTLYKREMKGTTKSLLIFAGVLTLYFTITISLFDVTVGSVLNEITEAMPEIMAVVGMKATPTTLVGFISTYLYGFLMLVFPMVFTILCANKLIARHVDRGSMSYLLSAPVKRLGIAFTQMKVLASSIFILIAYLTIMGIISSELQFPGELEIKEFILLNIGVLCLHLFIGGICFLFSCIFSDAKYSIGFGAGIPVLAYIIQMLANAGGKVENAKYATFFTLFNPDGIIAGEASAFLGIAILFFGAIILFASAIIIFTKKDLHV